MKGLFRKMPAVQREVLGRTLRKHQGAVAASLLTAVLSSACVVGAPLLFAHAVEVIGKGAYTITSLLGLFGGFAALLAGARLLIVVRLIQMYAVEQDVQLETDKATLAALLRSAGSIFVANNPARIGQLRNNLRMSNTIYVETFLMAVLAGVVDLTFAFIAVGGLVSWPVAVFVVIYGVIAIWLTLFGTRVTREAQRGARRKTAEGANLLGNVVSNVVSIKIYRGKGWVQALYDALARRSRELWMGYYKTRLRFGAVQAALVFVQFAGVFAMLVLTVSAVDLLSQVVLVGMILMQLNRPFEMAASAIEEAAQAQVLAETLQDELDQHAARAPAGGGLPVPVGPLRVELDAVAFRYGPDEPLLFAGLTHAFGPGALNFIIGPSGVGKLSLLQMLIGINDGYAGTVRVGGVNLKAVDRNAYLAALGYVPQEPMLMNMSIRDNVLFGREFSDAQVLAALDVVCLGANVDGLAEGLDYRIGEGGQLLSGGERQRLAIARALIGRPRVLVLDEASSALDEATEREIFATLRDSATDTVIVAMTHRLAVIGKGDRVLTMGAAGARAGEARRA